jgi:hypothetical protein
LSGHGHHAHRAAISEPETGSSRGIPFLSHQAIDAGTLERIRTTAQQGWALGSEDFLNQVEARAGRIARPPNRGRPFKHRLPEEVGGKEPSEMWI